MRRMIIIALLFVAMQLVLPLGTQGHGAVWLLTFGFLIIAADAVGELAAELRFPKIVGYLIAGAVFGPSALNTVTLEATNALAPVSSLAIALIAFLAGAELRWDELRERGGRIAKILLAELGITLIVIWVLMFAFRTYIPFLAGVQVAPALVFTLLFASMAIVHSPAVTMALLTETKARGPVARTTLGVVLVSDVVVVLIFTGALAIARVVVPPSGTEAAGISLGTIVWEIGGAVITGALLGGAVALYLRWVHRELFFFAILVAFFGADIARLTHVEVLLTLLTAGFVTENVSKRESGEALRNAMERSAAPVFVVFFALAGAAMNLRDIATLWPLVIPIVLVRLIAIRSGSALGARWAQASQPEQRSVWMGLIAQAGVAIGLATVVAEAYPSRGSQIRTLFLAVMAINQTLGPILFKYALSRSGELSESTDTEDRASAQSPATILPSQ